MVPPAQYSCCNEKLLIGKSSNQKIVRIWFRSSIIWQPGHMVDLVSSRKSWILTNIHFIPDTLVHWQSDMTAQNLLNILAHKQCYIVVQKCWSTQTRWQCHTQCDTVDCWCWCTAAPTLCCTAPLSRWCTGPRTWSCTPSRTSPPSGCHTAAH